jgi:hypothetical protein
MIAMRFQFARYLYALGKCYNIVQLLKREWTVSSVDPTWTNPYVRTYTPILQLHHFLHY